MSKRGRSADDLASLRALSLAVVAALSALAAFGVAVGGPRWLTVAAAAVIVAGSLLALAFHIAERRATSRERAAGTSVAPRGLSRERLEEWRSRLRMAVLEARVEQGGQLDQMVRQGESIDMNVRTIDGDARRPRARTGGRSLSWGEIRREWDDSGGRLVILGDPGYGKTVAALTLLAHINAHDNAGQGVAELFSLVEWDRWNHDHRGERFAGWLAEQLTVSYPDDLPVAVSRRLVAEGLVVPILDGLDEIPTRLRRLACVAAIEGYARRAAPHRPFVVTCRAVEYDELATDALVVDRHLVLEGLDRDRVRAILDDRTTDAPGWEAVRARHAAGDPSLGELFRSPLLLTVALQAYRDRDPSELLDLTIDDAQGRLWELLLADTGGGFDDATPAQVRDWLAFLAAGMRRTARQRLALHELYLIDPEPVSTRTAACGVLAAAVGVPLALAMEQISGVGVGLVFGLLGGLGGALTSRTAPSYTRRVGWRARLRHAIELGRAKRVNAPLGLAVGLFVLSGAYAALAGGSHGTTIAFLATLLAASLGGGLGVVLVVAVLVVLSAGAETVTATPPERFAHKRPDAVLVASRNSGLTRGLTVGLGCGLVTGLLFAAGRMLAVGSGAPSAALFALLFYGTIAAIGYGLSGGLSAWVHHYVLRWRLSARGRLPRRLPTFLEWCAEPARGWMRITEAYEFRHRELLDHLATSYEQQEMVTDRRHREKHTDRSS